MNRSVAIAILACVMGLCAAALAIVGFAWREPGGAAWLDGMDGGAAALTELESGRALAQGEQDAQPSAAPQPTAEPVQPSAQPQATAEPAQPTAEAGDQATDDAALATEVPADATGGVASGGAIPAIAAPDTFGTPEELDEATPRYSYGALALATGLDMEVLEKMYSPFYVLDIDMDEVYYPLTSPGGSAGNNKIYGGQVGVEVVEIEGDYAYINAYRYPGGRAIDGYVPVSMLKQVTPDDQYSIIIDKRQQRLYLFEYGELKADMYCSTGKTTTETPAGEFVKFGTKRTIYSDADPDIAYYGIKLNGRVYIHSVSHIGGDYSKSIDMLGRKASHGCIRVPLDWAEWFYNNIPDNTKIIITEYRGETPPLGEGGRDGD